MITNDATLREEIDLILAGTGADVDELQIVRQLTEQQLDWVVGTLCRRGYLVTHTSAPATFDIFTITARRHRRSGAADVGRRK